MAPARTIIVEERPAEEVFVDLLAFASDADGDVLSCDIDTLPPAEDGQLVDGPVRCTYLFRPVDPEDPDETSFTYSISDGTVAVTNTIDIWFGISLAPRAARGLVASALGPEDVRLTWHDDADNEDGFHIHRGADPATLARIAQPVAAHPGTGAVTWGDSGLTSETTYYYQVFAYNAEGVAPGSNIVSITTPAVGAVNRAPIAVDDDIWMEPGSVPRSRVILFSELLDNDTDPDGDPISVVEQDFLMPRILNYGNLELVAGGLLYTRTDSGFYDDHFSYRVTDGRLTSDAPADVTINIRPGTPAIARPDSVGTVEGVPVFIDYELNLRPNDDGDPWEPVQLLFTQPTYGRIDFCCDPSGFWYIPEPEFVGQDSFFYTIRGGQVGGHWSYSTAEVTVAVDDDFRSPDPTQVTADDFQLVLKPGATTHRLPLLFSDLLRNDLGDELRIHAGDLTPGGTILGSLTFETPGWNPASGQAPPVGWDGVLLFETSHGFSHYNWWNATITGVAGSASTRLSIHTRLHSDPTLGDSRAIHDLYEVPEGKSIDLCWDDLLANDHGGETGAFEWLGRPLRGELSHLTSWPCFRYHAPTGYQGADDMSYLLDNNTEESVARIILLVTPGTPEPGDDDVATEVDTPLTFSALCNDTDPNGDPLEIVSTTDPDHGFVVIQADGSLSYSPEPGFVGVDAFSYTVGDSDGNHASAQVSVSVGPNPPANDPPVATDDTAILEPETQAVTIRVLDNDVGPECQDRLTVIDVTANSYGGLTINPDSSIRYDRPYVDVPIPSETFSYTVDDSRGGTDTAEVTVWVDESPQPDPEKSAEGGKK